MRGYFNVLGWMWCEGVNQSQMPDTVEHWEEASRMKGAKLSKIRGEIMSKVKPLLDLRETESGGVLVSKRLEREFWACQKRIVRAKFAVFVKEQKKRGDCDVSQETFEAWLCARGSLGASLDEVVEQGGGSARGGRGVSSGENRGEVWGNGQVDLPIDKDNSDKPKPLERDLDQPPAPLVGGGVLEILGEVRRGCELPDFERAVNSLIAGAVDRKLSPRDELIEFMVAVTGSEGYRAEGWKRRVSQLMCRDGGSDRIVEIVWKVEKSGRNRGGFMTFLLEELEKEYARDAAAAENRV